MPDQWIFDPTSEGTGTQLIVSSSPYTVMEFASPAPPLEMTTAGSIDTEGDTPTARRHQNRTVSLTVRVDPTTRNQVNLDAAVATLEAKVAELATEGGTFRKVRADGTYRTLDIHAADQYEKAFDVTYDVGNVAVCQINLVARPYARGPEYTVGTYSETTLPHLLFTTSTITGDIPALGRMVVTNNSTNTQTWLVWGLESQYLNTGLPLFWQAESTTLGTSGGGVTISTAAPAGASGASALSAVFSTSVTQATVSTVTSATSNHRGTYRVLARVQAPATNTVRSVWAPGGGQLVYNSFASTTTSGQWEILDLGLVSPGGPFSQTWQLYLQAGAAGASTTYIDWVLLVPAEASGEASANGVPQFNVMGSSGVFTVRHDAAKRGPDGSGNYGDPVVYEGDYLKLRAGATSRFVVKSSMGVPGVTGAAADTSIDDISATLYATPRYLALN